ncbi:MAG: NAD(P)-binding domain-containing protein [Pseudomonadota bacterium]
MSKNAGCGGGGAKAWTAAQRVYTSFDVATESLYRWAKQEDVAGMNAEQYDVLVIGAGWSGLLACKYALEQGLTVHVLERRADLGGVWSYSEDPDVVTVMRSTVTSSSATVTEAADFFMRPESGNFLHHSQIRAYLDAYAAHFGLRRHISFGCELRKVTRDRLWRASIGQRRISSRFLVISTGVHQRPRPVPEELAGFTKSVVHCGRIKAIEPEDYAAGEEVLVYGGGESASDVVERLALTQAAVTWAIPNGQHFFRKSSIFRRPAPGAFGRMDGPLDEASSRMIQYVTPFARSKPGMRWLCNLGSTGSLLGYEGHGVPEWRSGIPFMHAFLNKNGHVVEHVHEGRVAAEGRVLGCDGDWVRFASGRTARFTQIIACCGYDYDVPFLPDEFRGKPVTQHYKLMFDTEEPSLLYIGFARPTVSSIPLMTELQCGYAFQVLAGNKRLPDKAAMSAAAEADNRARERYFHDRRRPDTLVDPFTYGYDLAELAGTKPSYLRLLATDPRVWWKTFFSPLSAAHFLLNDEGKREQAVAQIWKRQTWPWFVFPAVYLIARVLCVDLMCDLLAQRRYWRQLGHGRLDPIAGERPHPDSMIARS